MDRLPLGKVCTKCGEWKLFEDFNKRSRSRDGRYPSCRTCRRRYNEENREIIASKAREWYEENRERRAEYHRGWYEANRQMLVDYQRWYRKEYPDKVAQCKANHYEANREWVLERSRRYHEENRDKAHEAMRRRRARVYSAEGSHTLSEWLGLCEFYGHICLCCGQQESLTADHVVPLSKGGSDYISNIQPLCKSCNSKKGVKAIDYRPQPRH